MDFKELWTLVEYFVRNDIKTCRCEYAGECNAPIKDIYHLWTNSSQVHVRLVCENNHYDWHSISIANVYARYNDKLKQVELREVEVDTHAPMVV